MVKDNMDSTDLGTLKASIHGITVTLEEANGWNAYELKVEPTVDLLADHGLRNINKYTALVGQRLVEELRKTEVPRSVQPWDDIVVSDDKVEQALDSAKIPKRIENGYEFFENDVSLSHLEYTSNLALEHTFREDDDISEVEASKLKAVTTAFHAAVAEVTRNTKPIGEELGTPSSAASVSVDPKARKKT